MRLRSGFKKLYVDTEEVPRTRTEVSRTRLNFPSLVAGVRSRNKEAIRQFRELLLIEWSPPPPTITIRGISKFQRMAPLRKRSEAGHFLNKIVRCWCSSRKNTNDLLVVNYKQHAQFVEMWFREFISLGLVLVGVWSDQSDLQLFATQKLRIVLFDTLCPVDAPFILEYGIVPRLDEFLERKNVPLLQIEAALAVIDICSTALTYSNLWIDLDLVKILLKILDFPSCDVRDKVVLQLGILAETCEGRELVYQHEALHPLLDKVLRPLLDKLDKTDERDETDKLLPKLRNATYTLLRFYKGEENPKKFVEEVTENKYGVYFEVTPVVVVSRHLDKMKNTIPELSRLIGSTDEEVLTNACSILACLTDSRHCKTQVIIGNDVCQRLVELLKHPSPSIVTPAIRTLKNIVLREDIQSQHIVDFGALPCLWKLLSKNVEEMEVWMTIGSLTKSKNRKAAQIEITNSQVDDFVRHEIEEKKKEVIEKLDKYDEMKLSIFCEELRIPFYTIRATKEEMVLKLMDFLEGLHATTAEEKQSSKGKKRRRESELEKDANSEESEEETANGVPERSVEQVSELNPSDDELCDAIGEILREVGIRKIHSIDIMKRLSKRFGRDMTPKEIHIRIMIGYQMTQGLGSSFRT